MHVALDGWLPYGLCLLLHHTWRISCLSCLSLFLLFLFLLSDFFSKTGSSSPRLTSVTLVSIHPTLPKEEFHTLYKTAIHTMFSIPRRNRFCLFDSPCQGTHYFLSFLLFTTRLIVFEPAFSFYLLMWIWPTTKRDSRLELPTRSPTYSTTTTSFPMWRTAQMAASLLSQQYNITRYQLRKWTISAYNYWIVQFSLLCILFQSTLLIDRPKSLEFFCTVFRGTVFCHHNTTMLTKIWYVRVCLCLV